MSGLLTRWGGGAQVLRGALGLAFPYLLALVPAEQIIIAPIVGVGVFSYIGARWLVVLEPATLADMGGAARGHWAEAIFVTLALVMALVGLGETGILNVGIGAGVVICIVYLIAHILLLPLLVHLREKKTEPRAERRMLRRFIRAAAFVAGEAVAAMTISLALHEHHLARSGPDWGVWDLLPVTPLVVLVVGFSPIVWLEMAATEDRVGRRREIHGAIEASLIQAGAILVTALTGRIPWL